MIGIHDNFYRKNHIIIISGFRSSWVLVFDMLSYSDVFLLFMNFISLLVISPLRPILLFGLVGHFFTSF